MCACVKAIEMSLGRIKRVFCMLILVLLYIPRKIFSLCFGRFQMVAKLEETTSLTADEEYSSDNEDINEKSNVPTSVTDIHAKGFETKKGESLPDMDRPLESNTMMNPHQNSFIEKVFDNEEDDEESPIAEEEKKEESSLRKDSLSSQANESVKNEQANDQPHAKAKVDENEDEKKEHVNEHEKEEHFNGDEKNEHVNEDEKKAQVNDDEKKEHSNGDEKEEHVNDDEKKEHVTEDEKKAHVNDDEKKEQANGDEYKEHVIEDEQKEYLNDDNKNEHVNEDEKMEHSGDKISSNPTSSVNQAHGQEHFEGSERQTFPTTTSLENAITTTKRTLSYEAQRKPKHRKLKPKTDLTSCRAGKENDSNSCYLDSTLFSLFYKENIFDGRLLKGEDAKETRNETSVEVSHHLNEIAVRLREKAYCRSIYVTNLRRSMRHINERIMSSMMDVDELLSNLLGKALHLNPFIMYCTKQGATTGNFYHQILINPNLQREQFGTVQELLEESMKMQHLTFNEPPAPALIIKMPRSKGQLVGHQRIIPNLKLDISKVLKDSSVKNNHLYELSAVITLYALHYTVYVRRDSAASGEGSKQWEYFNDLPPTIREVASLDSLLSSINYNDTNLDYGKITRDIHVCIYKPISL